MLCEWFIQHVLPLFIDLEAVADTTILTDIRVLFALVIALCAVGLLIVLPYKWIKYLLSGGKNKKV